MLRGKIWRHDYAGIQPPLLVAARATRGNLYLAMPAGIRLQPMQLHHLRFNLGWIYGVVERHPGMHPPDEEHNTLSV